MRKLVLVISMIFLLGCAADDSKSPPAEDDYSIVIPGGEVVDVPEDPPGDPDIPKFPPVDNPEPDEFLFPVVDYLTIDKIDRDIYMEIFLENPSEETWDWNFSGASRVEFEDSSINPVVIKNYTKQLAGKLTVYIGNEFGITNFTINIKPNQFR